MDRRRCFIIGAGEGCRARSHPAADDLVIAADGGQYLCSQLGFAPNLLVGDFDSSHDLAVTCPVLRLPVEKDDTDSLHAVRIGLEQGCREFHIYGGTGGRLDHTLANLQTLLFVARQGGRAYLYDQEMSMTVIENDSLQLPGIHGIVSVFCLGDQAEGVCISGTQYTLQDHCLTNDFPLGVSNRAVGDVVKISVGKGALAVLWEDK